MVHEKVVLKEDFTKAGREHEVTSEKYLETRRTSKVKENKSQKKIIIQRSRKESFCWRESLPWRLRQRS